MFSLYMLKQLIKPRLVYSGLLLTCITSQAYSASSTPTLDLFPISVKEQIRQTSEAAKNIETDIQSVIERLDAQHALFKASKCDASETDSGCESIKSNINRTFIELLTKVENSLPVVEEAMGKIKSGMEKTLRRKIGLGMTPRELQAHIAGKRNTVSKKENDQLRKSNLSSVFAKYYKLISTSREGSSIPTMAAGVYLDSLRTLEFTAMIKQEIAIAKVEAELKDIYSDVTPHMMETVSGVKSLLFGEPSDHFIAPADELVEEIDPNIAELQIDL